MTPRTRIWLEAEVGPPIFFVYLLVHSQPESMISEIWLSQPKADLPATSFFDSVHDAIDPSDGRGTTQVRVSNR